MALPLYDHNPFEWPTLPYATWALILVNVLVFLVEASVPEDTAATILLNFAAIPAVVFHQVPNGSVIPAELTLVTSSFLHGGWGHLLGNMIYLFVFGDDIEEILGRGRFLAFYLLAAVAGALAYCIVDPRGTIPLVGASGAIAGILAAYLMLRPCAKVTAYFGFIFVFRVRAYWVIGSWAILQVVLLGIGDNSGVAYMAHVGGFIAGGLLFLWLKPADVDLFECIEHPDPTMADLHGHVIRVPHPWDKGKAEA